MKDNQLQNKSHDRSKDEEKKKDKGNADSDSDFDSQISDFYDVIKWLIMCDDVINSKHGEINAFIGLEGSKAATGILMRS